MRSTILRIVASSARSPSRPNRTRAPSPGSRWPRKWFSGAIPIREWLLSTLRISVVPLRLTPTTKMASGSGRSRCAGGTRVGTGDRVGDSATAQVWGGSQARETSHRWGRSAPGARAMRPPGGTSMVPGLGPLGPMAGAGRRRTISPSNRQVSHRPARGSDGTRGRIRPMFARFKVLGIALVIAGIAFVGVAGYTYYKTNEGANALKAFSAAQDVRLSYNDQGQLVDRGTTEGSAAIMGLLTGDWGYTVNAAELDPNDPVVNTSSEYMYQMATIAYHTLHGTQTVVLPETVTTDDGTVYEAGTYEVPVDGRYWTDFDRTNPIDGAVREQAWTGTAHALIAELGVGSVTASALQIGLGVAAIAAAMGLVLVFTGLGVIWAARPVAEKAPEAVPGGA